VGLELPYRARRLGPVALALALAMLSFALSQGAGEAAAAPLSIAISGNHFVNGEGQTIRLLGVNHPSSEYACVDGFGYNDGHQDDADAAAIASWNADAVRIPINEDCWLGINGQPNTSQGLALTQAGYQQAIESYVADLNAHGLYAILDLHWTAPGAAVALSQQPMPDAHSEAFWASVAQTFKSNPAVVFDLFNEPFDPTDPKSGDDPDPLHKVSWECWDNGGCTTDAYAPNSEGETVRTGTVYQVVGMQTLLNTIRSAGATQPVIVGGLDFANDLSEWASHAPSDPLDQEAASFHDYMGKSCDNVACWNGVIAPIAAKVPVVTGEFDEDNYLESTCAAKTPSTFDQDYMDWSDEHGVSYLAWGWIVLDAQEQQAEACSAFYLIEDYGGTPAAPNGTALHDHLLTLAPGGVTTSTSGGSPPGTTEPGGGSPLPAISLRILGEGVRSGGSSVGFTLRSPENCTGTLSGQTVNAYAAGVRKHHRVSLGTVHFALKAGKAKTVVLSLSKASRKLLVSKHTLRVRITITLISPGHERTVIARMLTLKAPRRRSGH